MNYINQFNNKLHEDIIKLCHHAKLKPHNFIMGSKLFNNYQRVALIILFIQSGKSLRDFVKDETGSLLPWKRWLQLPKIPAKSTLHDWLKSFNLGFIRKLLHQTISDIKPEIIAIDGSGIDTYHRSSYFQKRLTDFGFLKPKSPWHKLDIIVDVKSKEKWILDFSFLLQPRHDSQVAWQLFKRFNLKHLKILGDKGYYWFKLSKLLNSKNNILIVPPKNYGLKCIHNNLERHRFHKQYYENEEIYSLRNNVESVFSSLKRVQRLKLRSKRSFMKKREMGWHIVWYNIRKKISYTIFFIQFLFKNWNLFLEKRIIFLRKLGVL